MTRELDRRIQQYVMGYTVAVQAGAKTSDPDELTFEHPTTHDVMLGKKVPDYSDTAAHLVVEEMSKKGWDVVLREEAGKAEVKFYRKGQPRPFGWKGQPRPFGGGQSFEEWEASKAVVPSAAPEICLAALRASWSRR